MKFSDVKGSETRRFFLLKFDNNKKHLESIRNGQLYMNALEYFVDLEKETGVKGMGDMLEAANVLNDIKLSFYDQETQKHIFDAFSKKSYFRFNYTLSKPVFCCFAIMNEMLNIEKIDENAIESSIVFSEEQKSKIIRDFGKYALVIPWNEFIDKLFTSFKKDGIEAVGDLVKYDDFNVNSKRRLESFNQESLDMFFWKDNYFQFQNEFRIVVLNKDIDKLHPFRYRFEHIRDVASVISTEKLLNNNFIITLNGKFEEIDK